MARPIRKMVVWLCKPHMSELGKELLELFHEGGWEVREYRLTHKASGVEFWIGNDFGRFRLYDVKGLNYHDESYKGAINFADRFVFWTCYLYMLDKAKARPAEAALNMVRMYKMKGEVK